MGEDTFSEGKFYQRKIEDTIQEFIFSMKVKEMDTISTEPTEQCSIIVDVIEDSSIQIIPEGSLLTYSLLPSIPTQSFKYINVNYPIYIYINSVNYTELTINVSTTEKKNIKTYTTYHSKTIMLDTIKDSDIIISITRGDGTDNV